MAATKTQLTVHTSEELKNIIARYVAALQKHIRVCKVILFGSYARGNPRRESDIDLAVISPDFNNNPLEDLYLLSQSRAAASWDIEALPYSLQQYEHCEPGSFLHEIIRTGVIMYDGERTNRRRSKRTPPT
jgi:predicted nucleotidyltransferase